MIKLGSARLVVKKHVAIERIFRNRTGTSLRKKLFDFEARHGSDHFFASSFFLLSFFLKCVC